MLYIKINNGVICAEKANPEDADDFVGELVDRLTDVVEEYGAEWCVGFSYGESVQQEYASEKEMT